MAAQLIKTIINAQTGDMPLLTKVASKNAPIPNTEPTERSNSPDIIRKDMPTATVPSSAASVSIEVIDAGVRNLEELKEKIIIINKRLTKAENSGFLINVSNMRGIRGFVFGFSGTASDFAIELLSLAWFSY